MRRAALVSVLLLAPASAALGGFTESVDLSSAVLNPTAIPAFTLGTNTVTGNVNFLGGDPADYFRISLPSDSSLTGISVTISNIVNQSIAMPNVGFVSTVTVGGSLVGGNALATEGRTVNFGVTYPISLGAEVFGSTAGASDPQGNALVAFVAYSYTWTFQVTAIPAPSGAVVLGLAGLLATRRRR